jgi:hypothetical protein
VFGSGGGRGRTGGVAVVLLVETIVEGVQSEPGA